MPRPMLPRKTRSTFFMALALAGGAFVGSGMMAAPAFAQEYSEGFAEIYQPVANVINTPDSDVAAVRGQFAAVLAAVQTPDDRFAIGNVILIAGNRLTEATLQRQGLELMLESGNVAPEQIGQFNFFVGNLAFDAGDFDASRTSLMKAIAAGYTEGEPEALLAQTYFEEDNTPAGIAVVMDAVEKRKATGAAVPENWLLLSLQRAYDDEIADLATDVSLALLDAYPTPGNWRNTLQVIGAMSEEDDRQTLDVLRLMRETGSIAERHEFILYIEAADPRIMSNEVVGVLAEGLAANVFTAGGDYYSEVKSVVDARASADRNDAPGLVSEAQASSDASLSIDAADVLYSLGDYVQAATMYQMALDKGVADSDSAWTRLGISQVKQGNFAAAQTSLANVGGSGAPIAKMWAAYAAEKSSADLG